MVIAVPFNLESDIVNQHYGKSEYLVIYRIEDKKIQSKEIIKIDLDGEKSIAHFCKDIGVDTLIIDHCGPNALASIEENKLKLICGINIDIDEAVDLYLKGKLKSNMERFNDHKHDHH